MAAREEAKLKSRLATNGKRRRKDNAEQIASTHLEDSETDPEELQKGAAIPQKRQRPDPFSSKSKKGDKIHPSIQKEQATEERSIGNGTIVEGQNAKRNEVDKPNGSLSGGNPTPSSSRASPLSSKKKKKKKARLINGDSIPDHSDIPVVAASASAQSENVDDGVHEDVDEIWTGFGDLEDSFEKEDESTLSIETPQNSEFIQLPFLRTKSI